MQMLHDATGRGGLVPPRYTLVLSTLLLLFYLMAGAAPDAWVYDRTALAAGEWWRLLTAHLVHSDHEHLLWNLAALMIIGWMLERRNPLMFLAGLLAGMAAVDLWLWFGLPELQRYCGLSGVLNTWLLLLLFTLWRETRQSMIAIVAAASAAKLLVELWTAQAVFTSTAWTSVPAAHLAGMLGAIPVLMWAQGKMRRDRAGKRGDMTTMLES